MCRAQVVRAAMEHYLELHPEAAAIASSIDHEAETMAALCALSALLESKVLPRIQFAPCTIAGERVGSQFQVGGRLHISASVLHEVILSAQAVALAYHPARENCWMRCRSRCSLLIRFRRS